CEKTTTTISGYENRIVCLTHHQRFNDNGKLLVSAALREIEGHGTRSFMILVPLGTLLEPGLRVTIVPKGVWETVQKSNERRDTGNLKELSLKYTLCHAAGCVAELEATPELITDLKDSGGHMVRPAAVDTYPIPLKGFADALLGQP